MDKDLWDAFHWGGARWLDHMDAEIIGVGSDEITCKGARNKDGGTRIDYFLMSRKLVPLVESLKVVLGVPWDHILESGLHSTA